MYNCKECGKSFLKPTSLGAHMVHHKKDFSDVNKKTSVNRFGEFKEFNVECFRCKISFEVTEREKLFPKKEKYFCSRSCSSKYSSTINPDRNLNISKAFSEKKKENKKKQMCKSCGIEFNLKRKLNKHWQTKKTCSDECYKKYFSSILKGKTGGYRSQSGTGKKYGSWYRNIWFDSKWEIEAAKSMEKNGIGWGRGNIDPIPYKDIKGKDRLYHPDFFIKEFECYLEVKGYMTEESFYKLSQIKDKIKIAFVYSLKESQSIDKSFFESYDYTQPIRKMKMKK